MADEHHEGAAIEDYLVEERTFPPPAAFKAETLVASPFLYDEANEDYEGFWARQASDLRDWDEDCTPSSSGTCPMPSGSWVAG